MASLPNRLIQCPGACFANCGSGLSVCQQCRARERGFASPSQSVAHNMMCAICSKGGAGWGVCFTGAAAAWVVASAAARSQGRSWRPASRARPLRRRPCLAVINDVHGCCCCSPFLPQSAAPPPRQACCLAAAPAGAAGVQLAVLEELCL